MLINFLQYRIWNYAIIKVCRIFAIIICINGKITFVDNINPRKIEFEGVGLCTTNGWEENVAIHYPGVRRMATRFTLPGMYNYKKTIANIVKDITG